MSGRTSGIGIVNARPHAKWLPEVLSRLFAREPVSEMVATRVQFNAIPETAWDRIMFYEEITGRPPFPLRAFMPPPVRTDGAKNGVGARIRCLYHGGHLVKRITAIEPLRLIEFEVIEQHLGIESCVLTQGGSYEIRDCGDICEIVLTTKYRGYLHPRSLWRPLEKLVASQLHKHVLNGMRGGLPENLSDRRVTPQCLTSPSTSQESAASTASESLSHL